MTVIEMYPQESVLNAEIYALKSAKRSAGLCSHLFCNNVSGRMNETGVK